MHGCMGQALSLRSFPTMAGSPRSNGGSAGRKTKAASTSKKRSSPKSSPPSGLKQRKSTDGNKRRNSTSSAAAGDVDRQPMAQPEDPVKAVPDGAIGTAVADAVVSASAPAPVPDVRRGEFGCVCCCDVFSFFGTY